jgi:hypothetical protein
VCKYCDRINDVFKYHNELIANVIRACMSSFAKIKCLSLLSYAENTDVSIYLSTTILPPLHNIRLDYLFLLFNFLTLPRVVTCYYNFTLADNRK